MAAGRAMPAVNIGAWLGQIFARRRQLKAANAAATNYRNKNPALY
jgi:hypothetical protein